MTTETDEELTARYERIKADVQEVRERMERTKDQRRRTKLAQWGGCLTLTLLHIESEMIERGLKD
jgi:hypothetical protein